MYLKGRISPIVQLLSKLNHGFFYNLKITLLSLQRICHYDILFDTKFQLIVIQGSFQNDHGIQSL